MLADRGGGTVVFVLSSRSIASKVCREEVDHASSLNKRIFPAVIDESNGKACLRG